MYFIPKPWGIKYKHKTCYNTRVFNLPNEMLSFMLWRWWALTLNTTKLMPLQAVNILDAVWLHRKFLIFLDFFEFDLSFLVKYLYMPFQLYKYTSLKKLKSENWKFLIFFFLSSRYITLSKIIGHGPTKFELDLYFLYAISTYFIDTLL